MSDLKHKLLGKPLYLLPNPLPPVQPLPFPTPVPLQLQNCLPLASSNPWDQLLNPALLPFPPPLNPMTFSNSMLDLIAMNTQLAPFSLPFDQMFPFGFPTPLLNPNLPKSPPVPLMSLRISTPPPFRMHPFRAESISMESKENKHKRSRRNSETTRKKSRQDNAATENRATQVINGQMPTSNVHNYHTTSYYTPAQNGLSYRISM